MNGRTLIDVRRMLRQVDPVLFATAPVFSSEPKKQEKNSMKKFAALVMAAVIIL